MAQLHKVHRYNSPSLLDTQIPARRAVVVPARDEDPAESDSLNECLMNDPAEDTAQPTLQQWLQTALKAAQRSARPRKLSVCHTILLTDSY